MDNFDVITQQSELQRRRQLMEALGKRSAEAPIVGNTGLIQALLKMATAYKLSSNGKELAGEESENRAAYGKQLSDETSSYLDRMQGKPGQVMDDQQALALMQNDQAPQLMEPVKADPKAAILQALTSQLPEMQGIGKAGFSAMGKAEQETFGQPQLMRGANGRMINVLVGNRGTIKPVEGFSPAIKQEATAGGNLFNPYEGEKTGYVGPTYQAPAQLGDAVVQRQAESGKVDQVIGRPPVTNNTTNVKIAGQKAGLEEWSKGAAKTVGELAESARNSNRVLGQLNQLESLSNSGTFNGPGANPVIWLGQLAKSAGIPVSAETSTRLQNSETFGNTAAELWLASMNANGGSRGLVKEESERIAQNLPALVQTPQGRQQIIAVMRQAAKQNIADAQVAQKEYGLALQTQDPAAFTFGLSAAQLPNATPATPPAGSVAPGNGGVRSWQDYLGVK